MKSKDERREIHFYGPAESAVLQAYLEEMIRKGWALKSVKNIVYTFKKVAPQELKYAVELLANTHSLSNGFTADVLAYIDQCAERGFKFVCADKRIIIFVDAADGLLPVLTDEHNKRQLIKKQKFCEAAAAFAILGLALFYVFFQTVRGGVFALLTDSEAVLFAPLFLFGIPFAFARPLRHAKQSVSREGQTGGATRRKWRKRLLITVFGFFGVWVIWNFVLLYKQACYLTLIRTIAALLLVSLIPFGIRIKNQIGLKKLLGTLTLSVAGLFLLSVFVTFTIFLPSVFKLGADAVCRQSFSALGGQTEFTVFFAQNETDEHIRGFQSRFEFLRALYLRHEGCFSSEKVVYDSGFGTNVVIGQNGTRFILYDNSVLWIPKDVSMNEHQTKRICEIANQPIFEFGFTTQTQTGKYEGAAS